MALARAWAVALTGVTGHLIAVEADLAAGLPGTTVIGMGDAAVTQARDRIRAAVVNSGQKWPDRRITLALSPMVWTASKSPSRLTSTVRSRRSWASGRRRTVTRRIRDLP